MSALDPRLAPSYSDNERLNAGDRLAAEIEKDPARLDVASGYFAPSLWAAVGTALQRLEHFRLLIGKEHESDRLSTKQESEQVASLVQAAIRNDTEPTGLVDRNEAERLHELIAFLERHRDRAGEAVKLWEGKGFLHAKAYILAECVGIGSANFTHPGLRQNRELVGWRQDRNAVQEVQEWFDRYWDHPDSTGYTDRLIEALRATPQVSDQYTPYQVLIRALAARYGTDRPPSLQAAQFKLEWFQEDPVMRVVRLLNSRARGALLADAVGLGKTYVAMAVIHHYLYTQAERHGRGRPVLLIIPASLKEMWQRALEETGLDWACKLLTTQTLRDDFDTSACEGADLVVIDEAHRLRSGGTWFRKAIDIVTSGEHATDKRVLLLTATPVNTSMDDLVNLLRVLTKNDRSVWAPEIADFERYLDRVDRHDADPFPVLDRSIVRRSRRDILEAYDNARAAGQNPQRVKLPDRRTQHIDYRYDSAGDDLFADFAEALSSLTLAPYDLERFHSTRDNSAERLPPITIFNPEAQESISVEVPGFASSPLARLFAAGMLTRFQSSLPAVRTSLRRLDAVLRRYGEALQHDPPRLLDLQGSPRVKQLLRYEATGGDRDEEEPLTAQADGLPDERLEEEWAQALRDARELHDPHEYRLGDLRAALEHDRRIIADLLGRLPADEDDGKFDALLTALKTKTGGTTGAPALAERRVLLFTQFRDTARYLHRRLAEHEQDIGRAALTDGGISTAERTRITAYFDPGRRDDAEMQTRSAGGDAPRILVSTDVLAEGHNLQLADTVVNYDLHFNPQIAVQRAGRVDRLGSPHKTVWLVSMLPPENLDQHVGLLAALDERFKRIHALGLGDEKTTPLTADVQGRTLEQIRRLYADDASVLDEIERTWTFGSTDYMRFPLAAFLRDAGTERLREIPMGVASVKRLPPDWRHGEGVFIAFAAPASAPGEQRETYWRFYPRAADGTYGEPLADDVEIFRVIACHQPEPRASLEPLPSGPGVFDWDLVAHAAHELAHHLTLQHAQAEMRRGASERSRKMRSEIRASVARLDEIPNLDQLLERLLQVPIEDYDGRSGWREFDDARRRLRRAQSQGEARDAAVDLAARGSKLLGGPTDDEVTIAAAGVAAAEIQLIAYEALVPTQTPLPPAPREQLPMSV